jgi:CheY-like chemotaxis protein
VIVGLEEILQDRVGRPLGKTEHGEALAEAKRRGQAKIPPGYMDSAKDSEEAAAGDYLLWAQVLREARRRSRDVLLVTGDVKEDWWRRERNELRGPRRELVEELQSVADMKLFMLRPDSFMVHARAALQVDVRDESVEDVDRVDRSLARRTTREPFAGMHVLCVDDNPSNVDQLVYVLEGLGATVNVYDSIASAEPEVMRGPVDVLISDITRGDDPDAGFKDVEQLRNSGYSGPVVFFTARITPQRRQRAQELKAIAIVNAEEDVADALRTVMDDLQKSRHPVRSSQ